MVIISIWETKFLSTSLLLMKSYLTDRRIIIFIKNDFQIQYEYKYIYFFNSFSQIYQQPVHAWRNHVFSLCLFDISPKWSEKKLRYSPIVQLKFLYTCLKFHRIPCFYFRFVKEIYMRYGITQNGIASGLQFKDLKKLAQLSV
jgi:hypothetical protein